MPDFKVAAYSSPEDQVVVAMLDPRLPVCVTERVGARAHVVCENGWAAWVEGDRLHAVIDTGPVWSAIETAVATLRGLLADFQAGTIDEATYRTKTFEAALIVNDGDAWMVDLVNQRVHRFDGFQLRTLDLTEPPGA